MIDSMEQEDFDIRNQQPVTSRERDFENALRPLNFEDFSGQLSQICADCPPPCPAR